MEIGWIKLYRKIRENWLWKRKPFDAAHAWVDLLLRVNFDEKAIPNPRKLGPSMLRPGECIVSLRGLERTWGWSRNRVIRFLNALKTEHMIGTTNETSYTRINVLNYKAYQVDDRHTEPPTEPPRGTSNGTTDGTPGGTTGGTHPKKGKKFKEKEPRTHAHPGSYRGASPPRPPKVSPGDRCRHPDRHTVGTRNGEELQECSSPSCNNPVDRRIWVKESPKSRHN